MKIYKKIMVSLAFVAVAVPSLMAEDTSGKPNVLIDYFSYRTDIGQANANQLRNCVIEGIQNTNRVDLIDVSTNSLLSLEEDRRNQGVDADGDLDRMKVMQQQGANALIQGEITSMVVNEHVDKSDGHKYYDAVVTYTLKVVDPNTGKTIHSKSFKHGGELLNLQTSPTPDEAVMKVSKMAVKSMRPFTEEAFPVYGSILEPNEVKKDEIKTAYISVGSDAGVSKGNRFEICLERQVAGRTSQSVIGEMEIEAVEGGDISLAKVKKGGKELKSALDNGQTIILKSKPKGEGIFKGASL